MFIVEFTFILETYSKEELARKTKSLGDVIKKIEEKY